jgi:hypothetical protein
MKSKCHLCNLDESILGEKSAPNQLKMQPTSRYLANGWLLSTPRLHKLTLCAKSNIIPVKVVLRKRLLLTTKKAKDAESERVPASAVRQNSTRQSDTFVTGEELQRLLSLCIDLLAICARAAGRIDPAVGAMIAYARDEVVESAQPTIRASSSIGSASGKGS